MSDTRTQPRPPQKPKRAAAGSFMGAVVEWYDFLLYGILAATVLDSAFFPEVSEVVGTLAAFATFGVGFLCRPLGGLFFGHFGDRIGRKRMLVWTVTVMGVASALIGLLPTYASIRWLAPLLLTLLRAVQGFAVGGEWGGASLMAVENTPAKLKAFFSSGVQVGYSVCLILATSVVALMQGAVGDASFASWVGGSRSCSALCSSDWRCGFARECRRASSSRNSCRKTRPSPSAPRSWRP